MKIAVITGAASGIGAACAAEFAAKKYQVIGVDIQQPVEKPTADVFLEYHTVDLSKMAQIDEFVEKISKTIDHVDVVVNCAGLTIVKPFQQMTEHDFDYVMAVNLKAPFFLTQKLLPLMTRGEYSNRSVVNISSVHATATIPHMASYTASKGGLSALTRTLALELAKVKIRVNAVQPGAIHTPMLIEGYRALYSSPDVNLEEYIAKDAENIPAGRQGNGKDIANAVLFLANEENSFVTGESLVVDGGFLARLSTK
uniref:SDR family oxidoreductase n=1 Tax=Plectus sambesii TaxID=2011161 RepID=A0A914X4Z3_9BILA